MLLRLGANRRLTPLCRTYSANENVKLSRKEKRRMEEDAHKRVSAKLIQGKTGAWEIVIGLEVHAQVITKSKLFSGVFVL